MKRKKENMYNMIVCGGTFDRLHSGHKAFLDEAFTIARKVVIGLTSDEYVGKYKKGSILPFESRLKELKQFLQEKGYLERAEIIAINDLYGPTLNPSYIFDGIFVSSTTQKGAEEVNRTRRQQGLSELPIIVGSLITSDTGEVLSSTLVRNGKVGRNGEFFPNPLWTRQTLFLPLSLRELLKKPFGQLIAGELPKNINAQTTVTVGDFTTKRFNTENKNQILSLIDYKVERKKLFTNKEELGFIGNEKVFSIKNPPGQLTPEVWISLEEHINSLSFTQKRLVGEIDGEDDLLVIPLILLLPLGFTLFYGQPGEGVVRVEVTEETKERIFAFLKAFISQ